MALPTLIIIHAAWHSPGSFNKIVPLLEAKGHTCIVPQMASAPAPDDPAPPVDSNEADIQTIRQLILAKTSTGNDVVLIGHSSGGVITCSAIKDLVPSQHAGKVLGLIEISAFLVPTDSSIVTFIKCLQEPPTEAWSAPDETFQWVNLTDENPTGIAQRFYHDIPLAEAEQYVGGLRKQALRSMTVERGSYGGWKDVPVWYLLCTKDRAMLPSRQRRMVQLAREAGADITIREIDSSHSPFISRPEETVAFVCEAVNAFKGQ